MTEPPFTPVTPAPGQTAGFCQNCGHPLAPADLRRVGAAIYCEPCLIQRLEGPPAGNTSSSAVPPPPDPASGTAGWQQSSVPPHAVPRSSISPGAAAWLGIIPGVGAMYNEQYAKGIVHLLIFAMLVSLSHVTEIFGIVLAGWIIYMIIEAHHTARARRDGTPLPNPFGLNDVGERMGFGRAWPSPPPMATVAQSMADVAGFNSAPAGTGSVPPSPAEPGWGAPADQYQRPETGPIPSASSTYGQPYTYVPYQQPQTPPFGGQMPPVPATPAATSGQASAYGAAAADPYASPYPFAQPGTQPISPSVPQPGRFPAGAAWLIGLGLFFLLGTTGLFNGLPGATLPGFVLIGFGIWLFARNLSGAKHRALHQLSAGEGAPQIQRILYAVRSSLLLLLAGILLLLNGFRLVRLSQSWPVFIIGVGALMLLNRTVAQMQVSAATADPYASAAWQMPPYGPPPPSVPDPASAGSATSWNATPASSSHDAADPFTHPENAFSPAESLAHKESLAESGFKTGAEHSGSAPEEIR